MWKVPLFDLNYDDREERAVQDVIASRWLAMGEKTQAFENQFSSMLGGEADCYAVSSATAALHMGLIALGVGPGDEVVIPALTFVADANVVRMVGATPVLADCVSQSDWNVSAETIAPKLTPKTKAVIVVHFAGYPCEMEAISKLCKDRDVAIIEDVAHAPGASCNGKACGTIGDVGCFSFFSNKNLSVGEGGMVTATDEKISANLKALRSHGMSTLTLDRHKGRAITYDVEQVGLNYRMDEMRAALGSVQLEKLEEGNRRRGELTRLYSEAFKGTNISMAFEHLSISSDYSYHIAPVLLPEGCNRVEVITALRESGIQTSIHYPPFWGFTAYKEHTSPTDAPTAALICERELTLPLFPTMTDAQANTVVTKLLEVAGG